MLQNDISSVGTVMAVTVLNVGVYTSAQHHSTTGCREKQRKKGEIFVKKAIILSDMASCFFVFAEKKVKIVVIKEK